MEREGARSLHQRLMQIVERGAAAREHSRALVDAHERIDAALRRTVEDICAGRSEHALDRRTQSDTSMPGSAS
jgi:hypothetical protein